MLFLLSLISNMPKKNRPRIPFDDRSLPRNTLSKERMEDLEEKFAPYVKEIKQKLRKEFLGKAKNGKNT